MIKQAQLKTISKVEKECRAAGDYGHFHINFSHSHRFFSTIKTRQSLCRYALKTWVRVKVKTADRQTFESLALTLDFSFSKVIYEFTFHKQNHWDSPPKYLLCVHQYIYIKENQPPYKYCCGVVCSLMMCWSFKGCVVERKGRFDKAHSGRSDSLGLSGSLS